MFVLSYMHTFADFLILWALLLMSKPDDRSHPVAALITTVAAPYAARLYPTIISCTVFTADNGDREMFHKDERSISFQRNRKYESIMLATAMLTFMFGASWILQGLVQSFRNDTPMTIKQIKNRVLYPLCGCLAFSMALYNGMFEPLGYKSLPIFIVFTIVVIQLVISLGVGQKLMRDSNDLSEYQESSLVYFKSIRLSAIVGIVPMLFMMYCLSPASHVYFFTEFENLVRFVFIFAIILSDPYSNRTRVRRRSYRTAVNHSDTIAESGNFNSSSMTSPLPPPQYPDERENKEKGPPSYEIARREMRNPWATHEVGLTDISVSKRLTPVQHN
ncbi:unnamed protein product [Caenorhabditis bovis]|uniref:Uncharacterized protein n=1 Tax=Caenorhabditis bovis TaxID=2654633 RepID=A0A8S1EPW5_9PELO|nr:unnamed protein product [Caenorhabditis bovis]